MNRTFERGRYQHLVKQTKAKPNLPMLKLSHGFTLKKLNTGYYTQKLRLSPDRQRKDDESLKHDP